MLPVIFSSMTGKRTDNYSLRFAINYYYQDKNEQKFVLWPIIRIFVHFYSGNSSKVSKFNIRNNIKMIMDTFFLTHYESKNITWKFSDIKYYGKLIERKFFVKNNFRLKHGIQILNLLIFRNAFQAYILNNK